MKLYTNIPLNWPVILHLYSISRIYPCNFYNFNMYSVIKTKPIKVHTYAPINKLFINHKYYCYDIYNKRYYDLEMDGNNIHNIKNSIHHDNIMYIPKSIKPYDLITVYDEYSLAPYRTHTGTFFA